MEDLKLFCIICWRLWCLCNDFIHNGSNQLYSEVVAWNRKYAMDCKIPIRLAIPRGVGDIRPDIHWKVPDNGYYKANCSVVCGKGDYRIGIGVVIWNYKGEVMASCAQFIDGTLDGVVAGVQRGYMLANYGHILDEIEVLKRNNPGMLFRATSRVASRVVLRLAKFGRDSADNMFWMEDVPDSIRSLEDADRPM
ncbi:hypothetical protein QYF36_001594 [Acer negundo]|nr:hypothetical protein QYF36_001594 [Acer negundo]